jgi:hypothetical protein
MEDVVVAERRRTAILPLLEVSVFVVGGLLVRRDRVRPGHVIRARARATSDLERIPLERTLHRL